MELQDLLVLIVLVILIIYDVIDYFKLRHDIQMYGDEQKVKEQYPQNNMKEYLPPARKYDKADIITSTHRYYPTTKRKLKADKHH